MDIFTVSNYGKRSSYSLSINEVGIKSAEQNSQGAATRASKSDTVSISDEARELAATPPDEASDETSESSSRKVIGKPQSNASADPINPTEPQSQVDKIRRQIAEVQKKLAEASARLEKLSISDRQTQTSAPSIAAAPADRQTEQSDTSLLEKQTDGAPQKINSGQEASAIRQEIATLSAQLLTLHKQLQEAVKREDGGGKSGAPAINMAGLWSPKGGGAAGVTISGGSIG
jgi:hypothetical protein